VIWFYWSCQSSVRSNEQEPFVIFEEEQTLDIDVNELTSWIEQGLEDLRKPSVRSILNIYDQAILLSDGSCPMFFMGEYGPYWRDDCFSEQGVRFSGYGAQILYQDFEDESGSILSGAHIYGFGEIELPTGEEVVLSGSASLIEGVNAYGQDVFSQYHDSGYAFKEEGEEEVLKQLRQYGFSTSEGGKGFYSQGVLDFAFGTLMFDDFWVVNALGGTACPNEYGGSLSFFKEEHGWLEVYFDGPNSEDFLAQGDRCDGCGSLFYKGKEQGEVCLDPHQALNWESGPFEE